MVNNQYITNFNTVLADMEFQDLLNFDAGFVQYLQAAASDNGNYKRELSVSLSISEYPELPPPQIPIPTSEPKRKRFQTVDPEKIYQYEAMNQSSATKRNTKWGVKTEKRDS